MSELHEGTLISNGTHCDNGDCWCWKKPEAFTSNQQCTRYAWLECPDSPADQCSICPKIKEPIAEERLRNTRAWAAARTATLSGADVIVRAIDELLARRSSGETTTEREYTCNFCSKGFPTSSGRDHHEGVCAERRAQKTNGNETGSPK